MAVAKRPAESSTSASSSFRIVVVSTTSSTALAAAQHPEKSGADDSHLLSGVKFIWPLLMVVSSAFQAGASILKESVFVDGAKRLKVSNLTIEMDDSEL